MNDSTVILAQDAARPHELARSRIDWLILVHQIPPKPDYFRVKVRRRLQRLGAVALKNSVYLLPRRSETREDFEWLVREIHAEGGGATLCRGTLLAGTSDEEIQAMFRSERDVEYDAIARDARALAKEGDPSRDELARLKRRLEEVERIDYFAAPAGDDARCAVAGASGST